MSTWLYSVHCYYIYILLTFDRVSDTTVEVIASLDDVVEVLYWELESYLSIEVGQEVLWIASYLPSSWDAHSSSCMKLIKGLIHLSSELHFCEVTVHTFSPTDASNKLCKLTCTTNTQHSVMQLSSLSCMEQLSLNIRGVLPSDQSKYIRGVPVVLM